MVATDALRRGRRLPQYIATLAGEKKTSKVFECLSTESKNILFND